MRKNNNVFLYKFLRPILGVLFRFYYNPKIIGAENIPKSGPIIIVGNHKHIFDQNSIIISTKRVVHYMAKKEYFEGRHRWFFEQTGCISVDRANKATDATEKALAILKAGGAIGLFPEGTRNKTDKFLLPFKYGAVSMAKKTDAFLVPFSVTGEYKFRSHDLTIIIGKPFKVKTSLEEANKKLYNTIGNLMKKSIKDSSK